jgi:hypothetical protein
VVEGTSLENRQSPSYQLRSAHSSLGALTPREFADRQGDGPRSQSQTLTHTAGENTATASFRLPPPLELYFATHTLGLVTRHEGHRAEVPPT